MAIVIPDFQMKLKKAENNPEWIVVHHTAGSLDDTFEEVNRWHKDVNRLHNKKKFPVSSLGYHIGYHYFIDKAGKVTQGRIEKEEGAHTTGMNTKSIGICLAGNFSRINSSGRPEMPTEAQEKALVKLVREIQSRWDIPDNKIVPHRRFSNTECYGKNLRDDWVQSLLQKYDASTGDYPDASTGDYPGARWIPAHSDHFRQANRGTQDIEYIVIHVMAGYFGGTISWFRLPSNKRSPPSRSSAHYLVSQKGEIVQMVREKDIAFHAGDGEYNEKSIGIEHEDKGKWNKPNWGTDTEKLEKLYQASAALVRYLCDKYKIQKDRSYIIGHNEVLKRKGKKVRKDCPGPHWDWDHFMRLINKETAPLDSSNQE